MTTDLTVRCVRGTGGEITDELSANDEPRDAYTEDTAVSPEESDPRLGSASPPWSPQTKIGVATVLVVFEIGRAHV